MSKYLAYRHIDLTRYEVVWIYKQTAVCLRIPTSVSGFDLKSRYVGFVVHDMTLGHIFCECFTSVTNSHSTLYSILLLVAEATQRRY
jgi:hypothetical protein